MTRKFIASLLFGMFAAGGLQAATGPGNVGQEVTAGNITIPVDDRGTISVKNCSSCPERVLGLLPTTTYEIGDVLVRRETMRAELLRRPNQVMLLQLTPDFKHVARLRISPAAH